MKNLETQRAGVEKRRDSGGYSEERRESRDVERMEGDERTESAGCRKNVEKRRN